MKKGPPPPSADDLIYGQPLKNNETFCQKKVLLCAMVFGGGPLKTLKKMAKCLLFFLSVHEKCISYHFKIIFNKIILVLSILVVCYSKAF